MFDLNSEEEIILLKIMADAKLADATIEKTATQLRELSRAGGASIKSLTEAWKMWAKVTSNDGKLDATISNWINRAGALATAWDKATVAKANLNQKMSERVSQLQAVTQVDTSDRAYGIQQAKLLEERLAREARALAMGKQLEGVDKLQLAEKKRLNAEIVKGQAILDADIAKKNADKKAQDALNASLKNGTATNKQYAASLQSQLSATSMKNMGGLAPNIVNPQVVSQIKSALMEIQNITALRTARVKAILGTMFANIPTEGLNRAAKALDKIEPAANKAGKGLLSFGNFLRTAFGTLTAIGIFQVLTTISKFFTTALGYAQQFRAQMIQLNFSEAILSKNGMDITRAELDKFVSDIEAKYVYLSKLDATKIVSETAGAVQEFDISKTQLKELADAIAFIQLKNKMLGREEVDAAHVINAAMDARSNFFNGMGINITKTIVAEKAYKMGLAEVGAELTKEARFQAIVALLTEQTAAKQEELNKQLEGTPLGNQMAFQKDWADTMQASGEALITIRDNLLQFWNDINSNGDATQSIITFFQDTATEINNVIDALSGAYDAYILLSGGIDGATDSGNLFTDFLDNLFDALNPLENILAVLQGIGAVLATGLAGVITFVVEVFNGQGFLTSLVDAGQNAGTAFIQGMSVALETALQGEDGKIATWIKKQWKGAFGVDLDTFQAKKPTDKLQTGTPTGEGDTVSEIETQAEDIVGALEKANEEILKAQLKLEQDLQDIAIDLGRKMQDITTEYASKRADVERDYANKIGDINRDTQSKIADINRKAQESKAKAHADQLEKEREFQNKLKEMREDFLMDLDDALHARDARAILKLIKQYELEKLQAERKHGLDQTNSKKDEQLRQQSYAAERKEAEEEGRAKLADAQRDYALKMAKLKADEEAEVVAAVLAANRKTEDTLKANEDRLKILAADLVSQFNLTKAGLDLILALYQMYYGDGGFISQVMAGMQSTLAGQQAPISVQSTIRSGNSSGRQGSQVGHMAEGGTIIANRPTTVTFGERGMESASFTPIGRTGTDVNKLFSALGSSGGDGSNGMVTIALDLSPDIEARITKNTMNKTAQIITKTRRSK
jgi:hypothetical protein